MCLNKTNWEIVTTISQEIQIIIHEPTLNAKKKPPEKVCIFASKTGVTLKDEREKVK